MAEHASPHPAEKTICRVSSNLQRGPDNSISEFGPLLYSCRNYFFLLFGFLTSFLAPCREAAMCHHLFRSLILSPRSLPSARILCTYLASPSSGDCPGPSAGGVMFFSSLRCLFSSFFFFFANSFWRFWKLKFGFPTVSLLLRRCFLRTEVVSDRSSPRL